MPPAQSDRIQSTDRSGPLHTSERRPPGRSTRATSGTARASSTQCQADAAMTTSNEELAAGISSARPSKTSTLLSREASTARILSSGSTATTCATRSARSLVKTPVPAPISRMSEAPAGSSQSRASAGGPGRSRLYSSATAPKEPLKMAVVSSWRTKRNLARLRGPVTESPAGLVGATNVPAGSGIVAPLPWRRRDKVGAQRGSGAAVAHHLAKVRVAGSNPVFRSIVAGERPFSTLLRLRGSSGGPTPGRNSGWPSNIRMPWLSAGLTLPTETSGSSGCYSIPSVRD